MKSNEHLHNALLALLSWMFGAIQPSIIPITLSCLASIAAILSSYSTIKKNRRS